MPSVGNLSINGLSARMSASGDFTSAVGSLLKRKSNHMFLRAQRSCFRSSQSFMLSYRQNSTFISSRPYFFIGSFPPEAFTFHLPPGCSCRSPQFGVVPVSCFKHRQDNTKLVIRTSICSNALHTSGCDSSSACPSDELALTLESLSSGDELRCSRGWVARAGSGCRLTSARFSLGSCSTPSESVCTINFENSAQREHGRGYTRRQPARLCRLNVCSYFGCSCDSGSDGTTHCVSSSL